jgi:putative toxin-antitoxin system antitoxin component (TIGR02293 family)
MENGEINEKASEFVGIRAAAKKERIDFSALAIQGLKKSAVDHFLKASKLRPSIFYRYLDITPRALGNYRANQALRLYLTDRILDLAKLYAHGLMVFGSTDNFNYWLNAASIDLGGEKPIDLIHSRHGLEYVDDVLGRIEHGIPA